MTNTLQFSLLEPIEDQIEKHEERNNPKVVETKSSKDNKSKKEEKFYGKRIIKVYGNVIFEEENPKTSNDAIRKRLVDDYGYSELTSDIAAFKLVKINEQVAILLVQPEFKKKG